MEDRKRKSNRAQADYFELLVCQYLCQFTDITFIYDKEINDLKKQILLLPDGSSRLKLQDDNLIKILPQIKKVLSEEIFQKGKVNKIHWIGRSLKDKTTSDIDCHHTTGKMTRFSIKSIAQGGSGTIKNLGLNSIKKYLSVDFTKEGEEMWQNLRMFTHEPIISKTKLKQKVLGDRGILQWAFANGKNYQKKLNNLCLKSFNNLRSEDKTEFLNFILDANDKDLYVIIVNSKGVVLYRPNQEKIKLAATIEARGEKSDVGYTIYINNIPTYRIQTNNTNGIGISPFCQRIFFADTSNLTSS